MPDKAIAYARENSERMLEELKDLIRIPSISTLPENDGDMRRAAEWLKAHLTNIGMENAQILETEGKPVVYADWLHADGQPTVMAYGHYDVQPVDPIEAWESPPFEPTERDGFLYARGASDDKGQMLAQLKALESILAADGKLPVNVKVLIEGEEEIGSSNLETFVAAHADLLAAGSVTICDGAMHADGQPSITYSLRGLVSAEFWLTGPDHDLHSGQYGGTIHNPAQVVAEMVTALHKADGTVTVPGFYDDVRKLSKSERDEIAKTDWEFAGWQSETGAPDEWGESKFTLTERTTVRPTLEINGIYGGFSGEGTKTVIPSTAGAKITCRLVANQDPDKIADALLAHLETLKPSTVTMRSEVREKTPAVVADLGLPEMKAAAAAYEAVHGMTPVFTPSGGSIGATALFQQYVGASPIMINLGLPDDRYHSPNERFRIDLFHLGIETLIHYYHNLAQ